MSALWTNSSGPLRHGAMTESAALAKGSTPRILVVGGGYVGYVHGAAPAAEAASADEARDHRRRPAAVHDLPAVPARGGGRLDLPRGTSSCRCAGCSGAAGSSSARSRAIDHARRVATVVTLATAEEGDGVRRSPYDQLVRRARFDLPHAADPGPGRVRHRLQDRRGGDRPAQPRAGAARHRRLHPRRRDPRRRALTFVFVGGGYAGVEALAELEDMARYAAAVLPRTSGPRTCSGSWSRPPTGSCPRSARSMGRYDGASSCASAASTCAWTPGSSPASDRHRRALRRLRAADQDRGVDRRRQARTRCSPPPDLPLDRGGPAAHRGDAAGRAAPTASGRPATRPPSRT